jgi:hypothetical protein
MWSSSSSALKRFEKWVTMRFASASWISLPYVSSTETDHPTPEHLFRVRQVRP